MINKNRFLYIFIILIMTVNAAAQEMNQLDTGKWYDKISDIIRLTKAEKKWLKDHKALRISGLKAFLPFHYFDDN